MQKFSIFYLKIAKSRSAAEISAPRHRGFLVLLSHRPITKIPATKTACCYSTINLLAFSVKIRARDFYLPNVYFALPNLHSNFVVTY